MLIQTIKPYNIKRVQNTKQNNTNFGNKFKIKTAKVSSEYGSGPIGAFRKFRDSRVGDSIISLGSIGMLIGALAMPFSTKVTPAQTYQNKAIQTIDSLPKVDVDTLISK